MKLVLFDIDGTLVDCGGQARTAFADALTHVMGATGGLAGYDFSGKLDPRIVVDLLMTMGFSREEAVRRMPDVRAAYLERLERTLQVDKMKLLPGVAELVDALHERDDVALGLLTGNWEQGGRIKIGRFDLNRYFPFGSFGDDAYDRNDRDAGRLFFQDGIVCCQTSFNLALSYVKNFQSSAALSLK